MSAPAHPAAGAPTVPRSAVGRAALAVAGTSDRIVAAICRTALLVAGTALLVLLSANVVARYALHSGGFSFAQELPERLFPWFIAAGVALAAQHGGHMSVEWLLERSGHHARRLLIVGGNLLVIAAYLVLFRQAMFVAGIAAVERSPVLGLPGSHGYWAIAAACILLVLATAAITVRVVLLGPDALPKPNPEEMPT
jgi:TRAP-type C4-dicarboxylate transport system permease small subunit